jgi:putative tryptophan/tyrosine transport system substrate-binding protein
VVFPEIPTLTTVQAAKWRVGFLHPGSSYVHTRVVSFREGLGAASGDAASNVQVEVRLANEDLERLPALGAELAELGVRAICAVSPAGVMAARQATSSIPIIAMDLESDPVANGWAAILGRPGGNVTGIFLDLPDFTAKCLQLLREAVPALKKTCCAVAPSNRRPSAPRGAQRCSGTWRVRRGP